MAVKRKSGRAPTALDKKKAAKKEYTTEIERALGTVLQLRDPATGIQLPQPSQTDLTAPGGRVDFIKERLNSVAVVALERKVNALLGSAPGSKQEASLASELLDRAGFSRRPTTPTVSTGPVFFVGSVPSPYEQGKVIEVTPQFTPEELNHDQEVTERADGRADERARREEPAAPFDLGAATAEWEELLAGSASRAVPAEPPGERDEAGSAPDQAAQARERAVPPAPEDEHPVGAPAGGSGETPPADGA